MAMTYLRRMKVEYQTIRYSNSLISQAVLVLIARVYSEIKGPISSGPTDVDFGTVGEENEVW